MNTTNNASDIYKKLGMAFEKESDSANIYQGVRHLRKGRPHTKTFLFPSPKNRGFIACEGSLEPEMALMLELNPQVEAYRGQPIEIMGPKGRKITPDFAVKLKNGYAIIDVKPHGRLNSSSVVERMKHIRSLLGKAHIPHYIFTERDLCEPKFHHTRHQFRKALNIEFGDYHKTVLSPYFKDELLTVRAFRKYAIEFGFRPHIVESAAINNFLTFDLTTPWGEHTLLGINNEHNRSTTKNWHTIYDVCTSF
jgi:hypothetical protein